MSTFQLFQILYATHFVLCLPLTLFLWLLIWPAIAVCLGSYASQDFSGWDLFLALLLGLVVILWYYVWFGSIVFALRGSFPGLSIRSFSFVLGFVYTYWFAAPWLYGRDTEPLPMPLTLAVGAMQLIALCGMTFLPSLQPHPFESDSEGKKMHGQKDDQDWNDSRKDG